MEQQGDLDEDRGVRANRWPDAPWWAQMIKQFGIFAGIALVLLAFFLNAWAEDRERMAGELQANTNAILAMRENLLLHAQDSAYLVKSLERIHAVTLASCLNSATDQQQRDRCVNTR